MELQAIFLPAFSITMFTYYSNCPKSLIVESECSSVGWLDLANLVIDEFILRQLIQSRLGSQI